MGVIFKRETGCVKFVGTSLVRRCQGRCTNMKMTRILSVAASVLIFPYFSFEGVEGLGMEHHTDH